MEDISVEAISTGAVSLRRWAPELACRGPNPRSTLAGALFGACLCASVSLSIKWANTVPDSRVAELTE